MPCGTLKIGNVTAVICGLPKRKRCVHCGKESNFLCDFPTTRTKRGKWKTCDRPLCERCKQKGVSYDVDFCREHFPKALAAHRRRERLQAAKQQSKLAINAR